MPLYVGDVGNTLQATLQAKQGSTVTALDLSGATVAFLLRKPSGIVSEVTATVTSPRKGVATYVTTSGVISEAGVWDWQAKVTFADGAVWHGPIDSFEVHDVLVVTA